MSGNDSSWVLREMHSSDGGSKGSDSNLLSDRAKSSLIELAKSDSSANLNLVQLRFT